MEEKDKNLTDEIKEQQNQEEKETSSVNLSDKQSSESSEEEKAQTSAQHSANEDDESASDEGSESGETEAYAQSDEGSEEHDAETPSEPSAEKEEEATPEEVVQNEATNEGKQDAGAEKEESAEKEMETASTETADEHSQGQPAIDEIDEAETQHTPETETEPVESEAEEIQSGEPSVDQQAQETEEAEEETLPPVEAQSEEDKSEQPETENEIAETQQTSEPAAINEGENQPEQPQAEGPDDTPQEVTSGPEEEGDEHHDDEEHEEEEHHLDYSNYTKQQMVQVLESQLKNPDYNKIGQILNEIKPAFDDVMEAERKEAYDKYIEEGGEKDGFEYKYDDLDNRFYEAYNTLRDKRSEYFNSVEKRKEQNLEKKQELLERLRQMVDADETVTSMKELKDIQEEWKNSGPVPPQHVKSLWANYNALIDRFYDQRSIYFELKELDRRKNLELKLELCERAEKLADVENIKEAIKVLNELHEEFKHIGPIPKEEQEPVWLRFKAASDAVYARRKKYFEGLKEQLKLNQQAKEALAERVQSFAEFDSEKISDWNAKTKEILELQKEWESIGGLPREYAKKINKRFWSAFKSFFNHKGKFFKKIEAQRHENMKLKEELVAKAEELKDSEDLANTAQTLKDLQKEWKEIGPVPEKFRNEIYGRFKSACDHFFNRKRAAESEQEKDYFENLKEKQAICEDIEQMAENDDVDLDKIDEYLEQWGDIGFVPKANIKSIQARFTKAVANAVEKTDLEEDEKQRMKFSAQFSKLKSSPNSKRILQKKENSLRRQIAKLENDIVLWKNNISFFTSDSKESEKLKEEFNEKIEKASKELESLEEQLRAIHSI